MTDAQARPRFAHVCFLVADIHQAIDDFGRILGVLDPEQAAGELVLQEGSIGGDDLYHVATFSSPGCEIQLIEPVEGPLKARLDKKGEHVHHICFVSERLEETVEELKAAEIPLTNDELTDDEVNDTWQSWTFVHPKMSHGALIEVARTYRTVDGKWEQVK